MDNLHNLYRAFFENINCSVLFLNSSLEIIGCNQKFLNTTGYDNDYLHGVNIIDLLRTNHSKIKDQLRNPANMQNNSGSSTINLDIKCRDGSFISMKFFMHNPGDSSGSEEIIIYSNDIIQATEQAAGAQESVYKKIVDTAPLGILTISKSGAIIELNQKLVEILGSPSLEATKKINCLEFEPLIESGLTRDIIDCLNTGNTIISRKQYNSKWGKKLHLKYYITPAQVEKGEVVKIQMIVEDVTSLKKTEEELEKYRNRLEEMIKERTDQLIEADNLLKKEIEFHHHAEKELLKASKIESLGIFAGGIAHDFNNLLTAILGNLSLARYETDKNGRISMMLKEAETASLQAKVLTQQLLTFSKGGAPIKKATSIQDILIDTTYFVLSGSSIKCDFFISPDLWNVLIDQGQISQVVHNLIINSMQSMPTAGIISIHAENRAITEEDGLRIKNGDYILIKIKDQGGGIPEENFHKIFDPYFTTKENGSGLGLAVTYSIIKRHDGYITLESKPDSGTTFFIYLPATKIEIDEKAKDRSDEILLNGGRILVMDDDEMVLLVVERILVHLGFESICVKNGNSAIETYMAAKESGRPFDLVIMDLTIPGGMGGKDAMKILKEYDPGIKAIVSSGYSNDPIMANYEKFGFSGIASKPFQLNELKNELSRVITLNNS